MYCLFAVNYSVIPDCNLTLMLSSLYTLFFFVESMDISNSGLWRDTFYSELRIRVTYET